jgi:hypothetical protein
VEKSANPSPVATNVCPLIGWLVEDTGAAPFVYAAIVWQICQKCEINYIEIEIQVSDLLRLSKHD